MADARSTSQEVQSEILDAVRKSQDAVVDAIKRWAETVQSLTPSIPVPNLPYSDKLPKPEEFVASAYDFAEQLLASQRNFAESVLQATKPLTGAKNGTTGSKTK
jgi:hypothetical protein